MDVGGRSDHQADDASAWLAAALRDCGGESAPLACYRGVDREPAITRRVSQRSVRECSDPALSGRSSASPVSPWIIRTRV